MQGASSSSDSQTAVAEKKREIRRKYKEFGGPEKNQQVAQQIANSAEVEYQNSSVFGWGAFFMVDRLQSKLTGCAFTMNTQKTLDAEKLQEQAPNSGRP
jgi:hypothetical protein